MSATLAKNNILYFTVATAGHVDHGKTSLLRALTGIDPDRLKEEKERGLTTDLGFAHLVQKTDEGSVVKIGFVDVPGHGKFLKNMLAGVGGIDLALLVVAADEGPMPQTEQHSKILALLGIENVLVLITKIDLASPEQAEASSARTRQLLASHGLKCLACLHVSSTTREGLDKIAPALMSFLKTNIDRGGTMEDPVYLPIDRVFTKTGYGTVITGTLVRGCLTVGESVFIEPGKMTARIRGMESFGKAVENASAGQRLAVNLVLKQSKALERGQAIFLTPPSECENLIARFNLFAEDSIDELLTSLLGQQLRLYHGTAEVAGNLRWLEVIQSNTGPALIGQISLNQPLIAEPGEKFVARYEDTGVTGGDILVGARARWLSRKKLLPLLELVLNEDFPAAIQLFIELSPYRLVKAEALMSVLPLAQRILLSTQMLEGKLVALGDYVTTAKAREELFIRILSVLDRLEEDSTDGINLEALRAKTLGHLDRSVFQSLVKTLVECGRATKAGDKLVSSKFVAAVSEAKDAASAREAAVMSVLEKQVCIEVKEVARLLGLTVAETEKSLSHLARENRATIVAHDFASTMDWIDQAHDALARLWQQKREISPSDFKEALNISRKYAMPLLSYFDDRNVTRRVANNRVLLKAPRARSS